jgi:hypothetical protein
MASVEQSYQEALDASSQQADASYERSWFYYLADIAARRLLQRVMDVFYKTSNATWLTASPSYMKQMAEEFERQLEQW